MMLGVVQARVSSTRLPGKVLESVAGRSLVWHTATRLAAAGVADRVVVATSDDPSDDRLARHCAKAGLTCFRGSLHDVLDRFHEVASRYGARHVIRATADCPMLDPEVVERVVARYRIGDRDYVSNALPRTFPRGLDVEVFSFEALECAWTEARLPSEREHVTSFVWNRPERFRLDGVRQAVDRSQLRWTVDEPADLEFVRAVFDRLGTTSFGQREVLELLERQPELARINAGIDADEGYRRSLEDDARQGRR